MRFISVLQISTNHFCAAFWLGFVTYQPYDSAGANHDHSYWQHFSYILYIVVEHKDFSSNGMGFNSTNGMSSWR